MALAFVTTGLVVGPANAPAVAQSGPLCTAVADLDTDVGYAYKDCSVNTDSLSTPRMPPPCQLWDLAVRAEWDPLLDPPPPPPSEYEIWVLWICSDGGYGSYMFTIFIADPPSPEEIRDGVFARIKPPNPLAVTSPDFQDVIVKAQTWLWLEGYVWAPLEDSDSAGGISVTVRATPRYARWAMGEGRDVVCSGPGVPWTVGAGDVDTYCSYTYFDSSAITASGVFEASVSVLWEFEWWEDGVYRGVFATVEPANSFTVDVDELQAIETGD